jgi:type I restriction enzyme M protein
MTEQIAEHGCVLTPGRYVGAAASDEDDEPFDEKMKRLTAELAEQFAEGRRLEEEIRASLGSIGYGL